LRVPDTLLDAVKEEQNRAREAGRGTRGGSAGGNRGGAVSHFSSPWITVDMFVWLQVGGHHHEVRFLSLLIFLWVRLMIRSGRGGRGGPLRGGRGRGRGI
jgi:U6 snRNA-associated Sm-like protein LSm4